jgi:hypothetical protein
MSIQQVISRSFAAAFVMSLAGSAFARQPPALVRAQEAADRAAACHPGSLQSSPGYRDAFYRSVSSPERVVVAGAGYRAAFARTGVPSEPIVACAPAPRLTASR